MEAEDIEVRHPRRFVVYETGERFVEFQGVVFPDGDCVITRYNDEYEPNLKKFKSFDQFHDKYLGDNEKILFLDERDDLESHMEQAEESKELVEVALGRALNEEEQLVFDLTYNLSKVDDNKLAEKF
jgi:hypothetical protein